MVISEANAAPDQRARFLARLRPGACSAYRFNFNISNLEYYGVDTHQDFLK